MDSREELGREDIFSKALKAGKRTYFFDVKQTKNGEKFLIITESKKKFNEDDGSFSYEKHKIFLYKEDYDNFQNALDGVLNFIKTGVKPIEEEVEEDREENNLDDIKFE